MKSVSLAAALVLAMAAPAFAADDGAKVRPGKTTADPAAAKSAKPDDKLICTRETATDSIIPKRVCRTPAQIEEERRIAEQLNDDRKLVGGRPEISPGR